MRRYLKSPSVGFRRWRRGGGMAGAKKGKVGLEAGGGTTSIGRSAAPPFLRRGGGAGNANVGICYAERPFYNLIILRLFLDRRAFFVWY